MYIDSQYARDELQFKINPPETRATEIHVVGGLPSLPGTSIDMPQLNGHVADARALAAPTDVIPADDGTNRVQETAPTEFNPTPGELKTVGAHPLQRHHFAPAPPELDEPGKNSTKGGQEP
jgi:hypothetical protein